MNRRCCIEGCSKQKQKNTSFHRFPADSDVFDSWCDAIQTLNNQQITSISYSNPHVCGHHFRKDDKYTTGKKTVLHKHAIPSIFSIIDKIETCNNDQRENEPLTEKHPPAVENDSIERSTCVASDHEDFYGFDENDLGTTIVNPVSGGNDIVTEEENIGNGDQSKNVVQLENGVTGSNPPDSKDIDDEIIFVENNVEVIEIDDDDDVDEAPPPPTTDIKKPKKFSKYDVQQMLIANHPDVQLQKPKLDWKSDQFRLVYIDGVDQNLCTCTKCWELFDEINIDNVVKHARCNPTPSVSPSTKRRKVVDQPENAIVQGLEGTLDASVERLTISKIQTIAACMDVRKSNFYQSKRFLKFAQFLIDTGASVVSSNRNKFIHETKYEVLCSFQDQLKDTQAAKIMSILNNSTIDYTLSCEIWEDCLKSKTNVSLDLHYFDENFLRHRIVIGVRTINDVGVKDQIICDQVLEILKMYSTNNSGAEFLLRATAFVTSRQLDTRPLEVVSVQCACSTINEIASAIINEDRLKIPEKCLHIIGWLNAVSTEKITQFDGRKWENIYELFEKFSKKKAAYTHLAVETTFPQDYSVLQLLKPFHDAIVKLSNVRNNITKVFGVYKLLESELLSLTCDKQTKRYVKNKVLVSLRTAFADSDPYQICMFLDPSNRVQYNALESNKMDSLQSKIDVMINSYTSSTNGGEENELIHYMDDSVTSQQNQIELFLQFPPSDDDPCEFWRDNQQMPGLKLLARKFLTIPTYVSRSECKFDKDAKEFLMKRNSLDVRHLETMLMMNSSHIDVDHMNLKLN